MKKLRIYLLHLLLLGNVCQAGMTIESSRVVFSASDRERSLLLANNNSYPVIVQTWVDNGDLKNTPETVDNVPVIPLPAVFRLEPQEKKKSPTTGHSHTSGNRSRIIILAEYV